MQKRIIIIGATSGIGENIASIFLNMGYRLGIAGRRIEKLEEFQSKSAANIEIERIDICEDDASDKLKNLINKVGGMDIFILCSGVGSQNKELDPSIEIATAKTNVIGFIRMTTAVFNYYKELDQPEKQLVVISSIAGTKGLGVAPAYSATKAMQNTYIDALAQLSKMENYNIHFTDIRPGFIKTDLLKTGKYPLTMSKKYASKKIVKAIIRGKRISVIDWKYRIIVFFWKLIPECIWERLNIHN